MQVYHSAQLLNKNVDVDEMAIFRIISKKNKGNEFK
jgi:hypothetical protein